MNLPNPVQLKDSPIKATIKFLVKIFLLVLKPCGRIFWFIFEWPIKLAPILIIGGYSAALWEVDKTFLEQAKKTRSSQAYLRTTDYQQKYFKTSLLDHKYYAITDQEASARANMDRGKLVKAQFSFTVFAIGNEISIMLSNPFAYAYSELDKKLLAIYDHVQFMPAKAIETIIDGNWYTELNFDDDFNHLDKLNNDYMSLATKEVDLKWQTFNQYPFFSRVDYRHTAAGTKSRKTIKDDEPVNIPPQAIPEKEIQEKCSKLAFDKVKEREAKIKKQSTAFNQKDLELDLEEFEIDEYQQCVEKNKHEN